MFHIKSLLHISLKFCNPLYSGTLAMPVSSSDKAKDWQLEILMEKLRSKSSQVRTLPEISKHVRMTLLVGFFCLKIKPLINKDLLPTGKALCTRQCREKPTPKVFGHFAALY